MQFAGRRRVVIVPTVVDGAVDVDDPIEAKDEMSEDVRIAAQVHDALEPNNSAVDLNPDASWVDHEPPRDHSLDDIAADLGVAPAERG